MASQIRRAKGPTAGTRGSSDPSQDSSESKGDTNDSDHIRAVDDKSSTTAGKESDDMDLDMEIEDEKKVLEVTGKLPLYPLL